VVMVAATSAIEITTLSLFTLQQFRGNNLVCTSGRILFPPVGARSALVSSLSGSALLLTRSQKVAE
jgi:hypothetical protein